VKACREWSAKTGIIGRSWFSPFDFDRVGLKRRLSLNKTVGLCQIHRSNHKVKVEAREELTVKGQEVVDLGDLSVLDRQDI